MRDPAARERVNEGRFELSRNRRVRTRTSAASEPVEQSRSAGSATTTGSAPSPSRATVRAMAAAGSDTRASRASTWSATARGPMPAISRAVTSRRIGRHCASARNNSGLPAVAAWQAAARPSSHGRPVTAATSSAVPGRSRAPRPIRPRALRRSSSRAAGTCTGARSVSVRTRRKRPAPWHWLSRQEKQSNEAASAQRVSSAVVSSGAAVVRAWAASWSPMSTSPTTASRPAAGASRAGSASSARRRDSAAVVTQRGRFPEQGDEFSCGAERHASIHRRALECHGQVAARVLLREVRAEQRFFPRRFLRARPSDRPARRCCRPVPGAADASRDSGRAPWSHPGGISRPPAAFPHPYVSVPPCSPRAVERCAVEVSKAGGRSCVRSGWHFMCGGLRVGELSMSGERCGHGGALADRVGGARRPTRHLSFPIIRPTEWCGSRPQSVSRRVRRSKPGSEGSRRRTWRCRRSARQR